MRLSPEIDIIAGADVVHLTEGHVAAPHLSPADIVEPM